MTDDLVHRSTERSDVTGEFDYFERLTVQIENRIVRCLNPDLLAVLTEPPVLRAVILAPVQAGPKLLIFAPLPLGLVDEDVVVTTLNLFKAVSHGGKKIGVGVDDRSIHPESNHSLRLVNGRNLPR